MKVEDTRNIAFIGHGDSGKTSLVELMLFKAKATTRLGEISDGTTVCDSEPDEKDGKHSIDCGLAYCKWKDRSFNIIDTPGYPDFAAEAISGLSGGDAAFVTINALSGIMVNTRKMWDHATNLNIPKAILINKLDIPNVNFDEILTSVREVFGDKCLLVNNPVGAGADFSAVSNLTENPEKLAPELKKLRDQLIEAVVEVNDALLNKYLDGKEISEAEITEAFRLAILKGKVIPVTGAKPKFIPILMAVWNEKRVRIAN